MSKTIYVMDLILRKIYPVDATEYYSSVKDKLQPNAAPTNMGAKYKKDLMPNAMLEITRAAHLMAFEDPDDHHWKHGSGYPLSTEFNRILDIINDAHVNGKILLREINMNGIIKQFCKSSILIKVVLDDGYINIPEIMREFAKTQPDNDISQQQLAKNVTLPVVDEDTLKNIAFGQNIKTKLLVASKEGGKSTKDIADKYWKPRLSKALQVAQDNPKMYGRELAELTNITHQLCCNVDTFAKKIKADHELQKFIKTKSRVIITTELV